MDMLLICGKRSGGFCIRPATWAGEWDSEWRLLDGWNTLYEAKTEQECQNLLDIAKGVEDKKQVVKRLRQSEIVLQVGEKEFIGDLNKAEDDIQSMLKQTYSDLRTELLSCLTKILICYTTVSREGVEN